MLMMSPVTMRTSTTNNEQDTNNDNKRGTCEQNTTRKPQVRPGRPRPNQADNEPQELPGRPMPVRGDPDPTTAPWIQPKRRKSCKACTDVRLHPRSRLPTRTCTANMLTTTMLSVRLRHGQQFAQQPEHSNRYSVGTGRQAPAHTTSEHLCPNPGEKKDRR